MPFVNDTDNIDDLKTIDHERNITLKKVHLCDPDGMTGFNLFWHGQIIYFEGMEETTHRFRDENGQAKFDSLWNIYLIKIPSNFLESKENILAMFKEAINIFGTFYSNKTVNKVDVRPPISWKKNDKGTFL